MVLFNYSTKELTAKVVYYGPGLCGKTTNLQWIHEKLPIRNKGKMLSLSTETDRTLFFDFLPIEIGTIRGMKTRIQLYTVPGQVFYNATRRMVLKGADAIVFVCDSQEAMLDANLESWENMRQNLEANEIDPDEIPTVFQYNKRDLPNALPIEILNERLNPQNAPFYEAVALKGIGVEDTLKAVTKLVFKSLSARYGDGAQPPGRAPAPPRTGSFPAVPASGLSSPATTNPPGRARPAAVPPVEARPAPVEDLLADIGVEPPLVEPAAPPPPPVRFTPVPEPEEESPAGLPPLDFQDETPAAQIRVPPEAGPPQGPQSTFRSTRSEADEIRRRIANPGIPELEMDLEALEELERTPGRVVPGGIPTVPPALLPPPVTPPPPVSLAVDEGVPSEYEVPLEIDVHPGATRITLHLRLILNLRRR